MIEFRRMKKDNLKVGRTSRCAPQSESHEREGERPREPKLPKSEFARTLALPSTKAARSERRRAAKFLARLRRAVLPLLVLLSVTWGMAARAPIGAGQEAAETQPLVFKVLRQVSGTSAPASLSYQGHISCNAAAT
jgi:hypothetical protein